MLLINHLERRQFIVFQEIFNKNSTNIHPYRFSQYQKYSCKNSHCGLIHFSFRINCSQNKQETKLLGFLSVLE